MQKNGKIYVNGSKKDIPIAVGELESLLHQARLCKGRVSVKMKMGK